MAWYFVILLIFAFAAALVLLVLLMPVRYAVSGDTEQSLYKIKVRYFFGLIRFDFKYDESLSAVLSVFFKKIDFTDKEASKKRAAGKQRKKEKKAAKAAKKAEKKKKHAKPEEETKPEKSTGQKVLAIVKNALSCGVVGAVMPDVMHFLGKTFPKKLSGDISFALGDPAATGYACGALSVVICQFENDLYVSPDFESDDPYFRGTFDIWGYIRLMAVVVLAVSAVRHEETRKFIGSLRSGRRK